MAANLILVQSSRAGEIWQQFADAWGPKVLLDAYGWTHPHTTTRPLETFYEVYCGNILIGWGSLTKHPLAAEYWLSVGIFPEHNGKHYYMALNNLMAEEAFSMGAEVVSSSILDSNTKLQDLVTKRCNSGTADGWKYTGHVWYPVGYKIFSVVRELCLKCQRTLQYCCCCGGPECRD